MPKLYSPRPDVSAAALILGAALLLIIPLQWLAAACIAAMIHELCHIGAALALGYRPKGFSISQSGLVMRLPPMPPGHELFCAAAGPLGSLAVMCVSSHFPRIAVCAFLQGVFNCIPVYPLDGGRVAACLFSCTLGHQAAFRATKWLERASLAGLMGLGLWLSVGEGLGILPLLLAGSMCLRSLRRKTPCKSGRLRVQ